MHAFIHSPRVCPVQMRALRPAFLMLAIGFILFASATGLRAQSQSDDFNDGNDNGWTRYNPFAALGANIAQWSFPNGGYRIRTIAPSPNFAQLGPGRAGSIRPEVYSDFYTSVDLVNWNDTLPHAAGILARVSNVGLGTTIGYAFTWDRGNPTSATAGDVDISVITGESPTGITVTGSDRLHIEPGKAYRFVFIGRGPTLEGRVYELPDTVTPIVTVVGTDSTYPSGASGLVIYDNSTGGTNVCDITFDNFFATDVEPPRLRFIDLNFGSYQLLWPAEASQFVLQSSTVLPGAAADWVDVPAGEIFPPGENGNYSYIIGASPEAGGLPKRFFRLVRRPEQGN